MLNTVFFFSSCVKWLLIWKIRLYSTTAHCVKQVTEAARDLKKRERGNIEVGRGLRHTPSSPPLPSTGQPPTSQAGLGQCLYVVMKGFASFRRGEFAPVMEGYNQKEKRWEFSFWHCCYLKILRPYYVLRTMGIDLTSIILFNVFLNPIEDPDVKYENERGDDNLPG